MLWIKQNRIKVENDLTQSGRWENFSPVIYTQFSITLPLILKNVSGNLLDIGCGRMPFQKDISKVITQYDGLDITPFSDDIKYICDAQDMSMIQDQFYDSAICLEVLEHVKNPQKVLLEINRVLKPQGIFVLSVPHLSRLHSIPYDYYRFTNYGITYLLEQAGFTVLETRTKGKLLTFIGHQISTVILSVFWGIPILNEIAYFINKWLVTRLFYRLDLLLDPQGVFASGYAILAKKA